jgi:hypothetical protein
MREISSSQGFFGQWPTNATGFKDRFAMKTGPKTEFETFDTTVRKILTVSKVELQKREKDWKRKQVKKKRAKT